MSIPEWAGSMVRNYRAMFKAKYNRDTEVTDEQIWDICNSVFDDSDNREQDKARVEAIAELDPVNVVPHL